MRRKREEKEKRKKERKKKRKKEKEKKQKKASSSRREVSEKEDNYSLLNGKGENLQESATQRRSGRHVC